MERIKIDITQAQIIKFAVQLGEKKPDVMVEVGLYTPDNKLVTTFNIGTESWRDYHIKKLPLAVIKHINTIAHRLEKLVAEEINSISKMLPEGKSDEI